MKSFKKITALVLSLALTFTSGTVCFAQTATADTPADQKVFVTFVYAGNTKGEWVVKGTNVTPPAVPVVGGSTFCGWSSPLTNIQSTQHIYAVYKPNFVGDAAIEATKKSLPAPAISETNVADPNASFTIATPITLSGNGAASNSSQMQLLMALLAQQQAAGVKTAAPATATPAATAPAATTTTPAAAAPAAATPAATATTPAASTPAPAAAVGGTINFTDKDGNSGTFTQKEWNTLLNVYGGSEAVLRKHSLGDLKKVAAYYGG